MSELDKNLSQNPAPEVSAPGTADDIAANIEDIRRQSGKHRKKGLPTGAIIAICAAALLLAVIVGGGLYAVYGYGGVYPGVTSAGVKLSGMSGDEARSALSARFDELRAGKDLTVSILETDYLVAMEDSGITYNAEETAKNALAYGRDGGFGARLRAVFSAWRRGAEVEPVITMDEAGLKNRVHEIASSVASTVRQPSWELDGDTLRVDKGEAGYAVNEDTLLTFVSARLTDGDYSPAEFAPDMTAPEKLDANKLAAEVQCEVSEPTLDLEADPSGGTIRAGTPGVTVELEALQQMLESDAQTDSMQVTLVQPKYSDAEYKSLLFRDELSRGKSSFDAGNVGRTTNVILATEACNGVILLPGDTFSYNKSVGPRTYERGFKDAIVYVGTSAEAGVGGGICQVSSTIYYAVLRADLEIVERYAHSRTVAYVPLGEDATVAWGDKDFKFRNNTDFPVKLVATHTGSSLTIKLVGTQTVEGKEVKMDTTVLSRNPFEVVHQTDTSIPVGTTKVKSNGYSGYVTNTYRVVYVNGKEVSRTFENKSTYTRYDKIILENPAPVVNPEPIPDPVTPAEPTTPTTEPTTPTEPVAPTEPAGTEPTPAP